MNARHPAFVRQRPAQCHAYDWASAPRGEALRVVLALALSEEQVERSVPGFIWDDLKGRELWPSQQLRYLAQRALVDPLLWTCLERALDAHLGPSVASLDAYCPAEIIARFQLAWPTGTMRELVTMVWCLLKRRRPALEALAERLAREVEALALQRCQQEAAREMAP